MGQANKWERRDGKRTARRRMKVDGASNKVLQRIILDRAEEIKNRQVSSA